MKKGEFKKTDYNEIRECVECKKKKLITAFVKGSGELYRYLCKDCKNAKRRTGKISETRFKKGVPSIGKTFKKGHIPWHAGTKGQGLNRSEEQKNTPKRFRNLRYESWRKSVLERDGNKCMECGSNYMLTAHHIKTWKTDPELRFDIQNGISLCAKCHGKKEGFKQGHIPVVSIEARQRATKKMLGRKVSIESRQKMSLAKKGVKSWITGKKHTEKTKQKMSAAKKGKPSNHNLKKENSDGNK